MAPFQPLPNERFKIQSSFDSSTFLELNDTAVNATTETEEEDQEQWSFEVPSPGSPQDYRIVNVASQSMTFEMYLNVVAGSAVTGPSTLNCTSDQDAATLWRIRPAPGSPSDYVIFTDSTFPKGNLDYLSQDSEGEVDIDSQPKKNMLTTPRSLRWKIIPTLTSLPSDSYIIQNMADKSAISLLLSQLSVSLQGTPWDVTRQDTGEYAIGVGTKYLGYKDDNRGGWSPTMQYSAQSWDLKDVGTGTYSIGFTFTPRTRNRGGHSIEYVLGVSLANELEIRVLRDDPATSQTWSFLSPDAANTQPSVPDRVDPAPDPVPAPVEYVFSFPQTPPSNPSTWPSTYRGTPIYSDVPAGDYFISIIPRKSWFLNKFVVRLMRNTVDGTESYLPYIDIDRFQRLTVRYTSSGPQGTFHLYFGDRVLSHTAYSRQFIMPGSEITPLDLYLEAQGSGTYRMKYTIKSPSKTWIRRVVTQTQEQPYPVHTSEDDSKFLVEYDDLWVFTKAP